MTLFSSMRLSLCKIKYELRSAKTIISNLYLMTSAHDVHQCKFCTHRNDHDEGQVKIEDASSSTSNTKEKLRIPKRMLRKLAKLKSESPKNSKIKLFWGDKEADIKLTLDELQTHDLTPELQTHSPPDFSPEFKTHSPPDFSPEFKTHSPPDFSPEFKFPSRREQKLKMYRTQSRKAYRPNFDPQNTSILLFPDQGSHFVGMGKKLLPYPSVKKIYDTASQILNYDLLKLCLLGPKSELAKTIHCQSAILVTSIAAIEKLKEDHPEAVDNCVGAAGFGVGEYSALVVAGVLSLEDALEVVKVRAEAMQKASEETPSGMMTAFYGHHSKLGFALHTAQEYCQQQLGMTRPVCRVANYLYPDCKVIAGNKEALDFVQNNAKKFGINHLKRLPVSGAFHTELMRPAAYPLGNVLRRVELQNSLISVHSNVDATRHKKKTIMNNLIKQVYKPVKWEQTMHVLFSREQLKNYPLAYEVGPGNQLGILLKMTNLKAYEQYTDIEV